MEVVLDVPDDALAEAVAVMHRAFAEYARSGVPSGAMLETVETMREEITRGVRVAVATVGGEVRAVVKHHDASDGTRYFGRLGVVPEARGRGLAAALVRALREDAARHGRTGLSCLVRETEEGNIAFYQRLGMEVSGREERLSRTGATIRVVAMRDR